MKKTTLFLAFIMLLAACQPKPTPEIVEVTVPVEVTVLVTQPPPQPVEVTVLVTQPPPPTYTSYPTYTPYPTHTPLPEPAATPKPTATPTPLPTPTLVPTPTPLPTPVVLEGWQIYESLGGDFTVAYPGSWKIQEEAARRVFFNNVPGPETLQVAFIEEGAHTMFGEDDEENTKAVAVQNAEYWDSAIGWTGFKIMDKGMWEGSVYKGYFCEYVVYKDEFLEEDWPVYRRQTAIVVGDSAVLVDYGRLKSEEFTSEDYETMEAILRTIRVK